MNKKPPTSGSHSAGSRKSNPKRATAKAGRNSIATAKANARANSKALVKEKLEASNNDTSKRSLQKSVEKKTSQPTEPSLYERAKKFRAKKRFGQNFLTNQTVIQNIVNAIEIKPEDTVIEIGPGIGFLTEQLIKAPSKNIIAIEVENAMIYHLNKHLMPKADNKLTLIERDILKVDIPELFRQEDLRLKPVKLVGNLPYNLTSPILFHLCGELDSLDHPSRQLFQSMTFMVQKEVAERLVATPKKNPKAYNHLSVALQTWFEIKLLLNVPPNAFYPAPKVNSAVVQLKPRLNPLVDPTDIAAMAKLVRAAFAYKRKTLFNSLSVSHFAPPVVLDKILAACSLDRTTRPEQLTIEQYGTLAHVFANLNA